jgi:hypothetical protein
MGNEAAPHKGNVRQAIEVEQVAYGINNHYRVLPSFLPGFKNAPKLAGQTLKGQKLLQSLSPFGMAGGQDEHQGRVGAPQGLIGLKDQLLFPRMRRCCQKDRLARQAQVFRPEILRLRLDIICSGVSLGQAVALQISEEVEFFLRDPQLAKARIVQGRPGGDYLEILYYIVYILIIFNISSEGFVGEAGIGQNQSYSPAFGLA